MGFLTIISRPEFQLSLFLPPVMSSGVLDSIYYLLPFVVLMGPSDTHLVLMGVWGGGVLQALESPESFYPNCFNLRLLSATLPDQYWAS